MAAPTLTIATGGLILRVPAGTSGDSVTWNDVWDWDDGGGSSGGDGDVPIDGGGTAKVSTFVLEIVKDAVYLVLANKIIWYGDGSTPSYFRSIQEQIYFESGAYDQVQNAATKDMIGSCYRYVDPVTSPGMSTASSIWNMRECLIIFKNEVSNIAFRNAGTWKNVVFQGNSAAAIGSVRIDIHNADLVMERITLSGFGNSLVMFTSLNTTPEDVKVQYGNYVIQGQGVGITFLGLKVGDGITNGIKTWGATTTLNLVNPTGNALGTNAISHDGSWIKEQYTFNLHIRDKNFTDLAGAAVDCEYANLVEGSDGKSYKCIQDHTAIDATHKPITGSDWGSFWELFDDEVNPDPQVGGDWDTEFDYKSGATEFSTQTTDADGNIPEQTIQFKKWVRTSETSEARTHKITISKANYETLVEGDIYVNEKMKLYHKLLPALAASDVREDTIFNDDRTGTLDITHDVILEDVGVQLR